MKNSTESQANKKHLTPKDHPSGDACQHRLSYGCDTSDMRV
jgi:hypothetical protein